jgi:hypothetical protein
LAPQPDPGRSPLKDEGGERCHDLLEPRARSSAFRNRESILSSCERDLVSISSPGSTSRQAERALHALKFFLDRRSPPCFVAGWFDGHRSSRRCAAILGVRLGDDRKTDDVAEFADRRADSWHIGDRLRRAIGGVTLISETDGSSLASGGSISSPVILST